MRSLLLCIALLCIQGCASGQINPSPSCSAVEDCGVKVSRTNYGLPANKSVQIMVQSPMLIGGKPVDGADWPASLYAKSPGGACSSTLIGDRVLFMAAHCMANGATVTFSAYANSYKARCTHHPEYIFNETADWALCLVDRPVTGIPFESLGTDLELLINAELLLSGYGCVHPGGGGGNDGIFRVGNAVIKGLPGNNSYDIVTKGGAALCFGDSGGAAYMFDSNAQRRIVAVNSRGDIETTSYLPSIKSDSFLRWAKGWSQGSNNVRICGLHEDAQGCRYQNPAPQPDPKFAIDAKAACVRGSMAQGYLDKKEELVENIRKLLELN